jgi:hypothetical protein
MSFEAFKDQVTNLNPTDRRRLMASLISLEDAQMNAYRAKLRQKIDDKNPDHWLTIEQLDEHLRLGESPQ